VEIPEYLWKSVEYLKICGAIKIRGNTRRTVEILGNHGNLNIRYSLKSGY